MEAAVIWSMVRKFLPYAVIGLFALGLVLMRADLKRTKADLATTKAELTFVKVDAAAKETAAQERVTETAAVAVNERKLVDAIQSVPDTTPDPVRVALGCQRLRAQGTVEADLPGVCRPDARSQAGSAH